MRFPDRLEIVSRQPLASERREPVLPAPNLIIPNNLQNFLDIVRTGMVKYGLENDDDRSVEHASAVGNPLVPCSRPVPFDFQPPTVDFLP